jgi:hypothetical protein
MKNHSAFLAPFLLSIVFCVGVPAVASAGGGPGIGTAVNYISVIDPDTQANGGFSAKQYGAPAYNDAPTRARLCHIINPGSIVVSYTSSSFVSPGDNYVSKLGGPVWQLLPARGNNSVISSIACQKDERCVQGSDGYGHVLESSARFSYQDGYGPIWADIGQHDGWPGIPWQDAGMPHDDAATRARMCAVLLPGSVVMSYQSGSYYSPGDNTIYTWDGSKWLVETARGRNQRVDSITCGVYRTEICQAPGDLCSNLSGIQSTLPSGYTIENGQCVQGTGNGALCPNGTPVPQNGVCPPGNDGDVCANMIGVQTTIPSGYIAANGLCFLQSTGCPEGYILEGNQCVIDPAQSCSPGYTRVNGTCEPTTCSASYICSGSNLYHQDATCSATFVHTCTYGCATNACLFGGDVRATPLIVRQGETATIAWRLIREATGPTVEPTSCSVVGTNGDTWSGANGSHETSALSAKTTYTFSCDGRALDNVIIHILPSWRER